MHTQFTIFKKGLTLIAVPLLVQAVFIAVLVKAQADHDRAQDWAVHTKDVIAKVEELHRGLVESVRRGPQPGLLRRPGRLRPVRGRSRSGCPAQLEELRELVSDNLEQGPRIAELAGRSDAFLGWVADEDRLVRSGDRDRAMAGLDRGSQLLEAVRGDHRRDPRRGGAAWTASGWSASARPRRGRSGRSSAAARRSWSRR